MILNTTPLGFGSAGLTSLRSYGQARRLLDLAYDWGIRHFDTAPLYGQGYSEKIVGAFAKGKREKITIATKFGLGQLPHMKIPVRLALPLNYYKKKWSGTTFVPGGDESPVEYRHIALAAVKASLENSLRSLNTDYLDYYFAHEAIPSFLADDAREFLVDQKKKGVIRSLGIATGSMNIRKLQPAALAVWDVLQYESGPQAQSADIKTLFPEKIHFLHSCIKDIKKFDNPAVPETEKAGFILAEEARKNAAGKVLFFTRRPQVLQQNLRGFDQFYKEGSASK